MEECVQARHAKSPKRGYSIEEFGKLYGICRSLVYIEIREGRLRARKVGRRTVIALEDAEDWFSKLPLAGAESG
jgi:hypothetical protein